MYGLRAINNVYVPDGSGRDWLIVGHPEFVNGRSYCPSKAREGKRLTMPARKTPGSGPRPLTPARIEAMKLGLNPMQLQQMSKSGSATFLGKAGRSGGLGTLGGVSKGSAKLTKSASSPNLAAPA